MTKLSGVKIIDNFNQKIISLKTVKCRTYFSIGVIICRELKSPMYLKKKNKTTKNKNNKANQRALVLFSQMF